MQKQYKTNRCNILWTHEIVISRRLRALGDERCGVLGVCSARGGSGACLGWWSWGQLGRGSRHEACVRSAGACFGRMCLAPGPVRLWPLCRTWHAFGNHMCVSIMRMMLLGPMWVVCLNFGAKFLCQRVFRGWCIRGTLDS